MTYDNPDKVIKYVFDLLPFIYQIGLETNMRGSDFIFDYVNLMYYISHKLMSILNAVVHILILRTG